jgi:hypothetical protein
MPSKIQSHKRLLDEFSVVVVTPVGADDCAPCVTLVVVSGPGPAVVVFLPMTAAPMAPAITPPAIRPPRIFFPLPFPEAVVPGAAEKH